MVKQVFSLLPGKIRQRDAQFSHPRAKTRATGEKLPGNQKAPGAGALEVANDAALTSDSKYFLDGQLEARHHIAAIQRTVQINRLYNHAVVSRAINVHNIFFGVDSPN
jgi:hypothetical protein